MELYEKKGYLHDDFRLFHLKDSVNRQFDFHYHDFYKILILIKGNVNYIIEGKNYSLQPYDIVLVGVGEIHRPEIQKGDYERIIFYVSPAFLGKYKDNGIDLEDCFSEAHQHKSNVLRLAGMKTSALNKAVAEIERINEQDYGSRLYRDIKFTEFMILLNRAAMRENTAYIPTAENSKIHEILEYINGNLTEDITVDDIAGRFFISRYHLMHLFKEETGCSIGSYITQKRLLLYKSLSGKGKTNTEACLEAGFKNYSSFLRAYKNTFGESPREHKKTSLGRSQLGINSLTNANFGE